MFVKNPGVMILKSHRFESVGEWKAAMNARGFAVPLPLCHGLTHLMETRGMTFPEAFALLRNSGQVSVSGKSVVFDLAAFEHLTHSIEPYPSFFRVPESHFIFCFFLPLKYRQNQFTSPIPIIRMNFTKP